MVAAVESGGLHVFHVSSCPEPIVNTFAASPQSVIARTVVATPRGDPAAVQAHLDALTKPPGSLGRLEKLALQVGVVLGDPPPPLEDAVVFVFAADHGVAVQGVSAYPAEVTAQMCANFSGGG
ncbi:MAG: nicotinate-nucleotide--dimethylbenzimidazole phosphoribosyltransferase, partial [Gemmatimonadales bacterium]|nr:nicotinate-nucleotide--dimethylbenzimidazole phosphoribosyltransferase [Gemmatimonadales bacterium]